MSLPRSLSASALSSALRYFVRHYLWRACAAAFSGVLVFVAYQPSGLWWAAPLGFALFVCVVSARHAISLAWLQGLVLYALMLPWVGEFVGAIAWVGLAGVQSLYSVMFGAGLRQLLSWSSHNSVSHGRRMAVSRGRPMAGSVWFAALIACWYVATEWVRSSWPFGGFSWGRIAWSQVGGPFASLVALGGPSLVTFAVVFTGAILSSLILRMGTRLWTRRVVDSTARHSRHVPKGNDRIRVVSHVVALACVGVASCLAYFSDSLLPNPSGAQGADQINVAAIQGNVPRMGLDFNSQRRAVLDNHARQTHLLADKVRRGTAPQPDLVLWPENASDINPYVHDDAREVLDSAQDAIGAPILVGTVTPEHNRMVVWTDQGPGEFHDKRFLQPFGEYMPLRDVMRKFSDLVDRAGDFTPGAGNGVVTMTPLGDSAPVKAVRVGVATCYEVAFDEAFRSSVRAGAEILTTPTNNATFGFTDMTYQQLAMSRMRAIEYDRFVVVPATSGVSAIIDHDGRVIQQSGVFQPYVLQASVELRHSVTLSALVGPWVEWTLCAVGALGVAAGLIGARVRPRVRAGRRVSRRRRRR